MTNLALRVGVLLSLLGVLLALTFGPVSVAATPSPALNNLQTCVAEHGRLDVIFLIDESRSLRTTDPTAERVTGMRAALAGLERLTGNPEDPVAVSVLMMGFASSVATAPHFDPEHPSQFQPVSASTIPSLLTQAGLFAGRDDGNATDFKVALDGARKRMASRAADLSARGVTSCQAIVFFTDGKYDPLGSRSEGLAKLCRSGGINDALRQDGVTLLTVALASQLDDGDVGFLRGLTEGSGPRECGRKASTSNGYLIAGAQVGSLAFLFGDLFAPTATTPARVPGWFTIVPGIDSVLIRVTGGSPSKATLTVTSPTGKTFTVHTGAQKTGAIGGFDLSARSFSDSYVEIRGEAQGAVESGTWQVHASDPAALFSVSLSSSATPFVVGDLPTVRPGSTIQLPVELRLRSGDSIPAGQILEAATLTARISEKGADTAEQLEVAGRAGFFDVAVAVPTTSQAASYVVTLAAVLPDVSGIPVTAGEVVLSLPRALEPGPDLVDRTLAFGRVSGTEPVTAKLRFKNRSRVGGCVWLSDPDIQVANGSTRISIEEIGSASHGECLRVEPDASGSVAVTIRADRAAQGRLAGQLAVHIRADGAQEDQIIHVPVDGRVDLPPKIKIALGILLGLIALGCAAPLVFLHLLNRRGAGFTPPTRLYEWHGAVVIKNGEVLMPDLSTRCQPAISEFKYAADDFDGSTRLAPSMSLAGVEFVAVATGSIRDKTFRLFRGPYGTADAAGLVGGSQASRFERVGRGRRLAVPLAIAGSWFFVPGIQTPDGGQSGTLLILLADSETGSDYDGVLRTMRGTLPDLDFPDQSADEIEPTATLTTQTDTSTLPETI